MRLNMEMITVEVVGNETGEDENEEDYDEDEVLLEALVVGVLRCFCFHGKKTNAR